MNQPHDQPTPDDLDRLLQTWQAGRQADAERLSALQRQIAARLAEERPLGAGLERAPQNDRSTGRRRGLVASAALATAAAVLLAVGIGFWLRRTGDDPTRHDLPVASHSPDGSVASGSLSKTDLLAKARLFAEMQAVFGDQLGWLAETADDLDLGLADESAPQRGEKQGLAGGRAVPTGDERPLVVQIVVQRRSAGNADWNDVWSTEVIARDQQPVALRPDGAAMPAALTLWAYRLPDGMLYVESDLALGGTSADVKAVSRDLLENNRATQIGVVDAGGDEYRILETAATLDGQRG
jgi:hypothetical protein